MAVPLIYPSADYFIAQGDIPDFTFEHVDVKQEMVTALISELPKAGYSNIRVLKSDPQTPTEYPCIGINRANDDETNQTIDDVIGEPTYDPVTQIYSVLKGTYFQESLEIRIWHTNADERDKLYPIVKATAVALRDRLVYLGLRNIILRGGRDEQDTTMQSAPTALYWASITMSYLNPLNVYLNVIALPIASGDIAPSGTLAP